MNLDLVDTIILASGIAWNRYGSNEIISPTAAVYNAPARDSHGYARCLAAHS